MSISLFGRVATALGILLSVAACGTVTPNYSPSVANVEQLKKSGVGSAKIGVISITPNAVGATSIGIRASSMSSSVGANYGEYIAAALKQELELAKLLNPQAKVEIGGVLIKNNIAAGGISTNSGEIEAKFVVRDGAKVKYEKTKRIEMTWDSSFVGAIAIPKAVQQYPLMVQKLFGELFADQEFIAALKP